MLASPEDIRKDSYLEHIQTCLGKGLSAFGTAFNQVLKMPVDNITECIGPLADAAKLLTHSHYLISLHRRHELEPRLNPEMRRIAKDGKIEQELFGTDLANRCKNAQALKRSSFDLKAFVKKPSVSLNWKPQPRRGRTKYNPNKRNLGYRYQQRNQFVDERDKFSNKRQNKQNYKRSQYLRNQPHRN